mmetsp:Transcript_32439/g.52277  ORF Transcript_32439/g.52277 Transcript_32439/m.52277 type:complete len:223 (-) Transcript_32439:520-1188(-)
MVTESGSQPNTLPYLVIHMCGFALVGAISSGLVSSWFHTFLYQRGGLVFLFGVNCNKLSKRENLARCNLPLVTRFDNDELLHGDLYLLATCSNHKRSLRVFRNFFPLDADLATRFALSKLIAVLRDDNRPGGLGTETHFEGATRKVFYNLTHTLPGCHFISNLLVLAAFMVFQGLHRTLLTNATFLLLLSHLDSSLLRLSLVVGVFRFGGFLLALGLFQGLI